MRNLIKKIIREQSESKKEEIKSMIKQSGLNVIVKMIGGFDNLINIAYDGDIIKFSEDTTTPLVYKSVDRMNLYIHESLVERLGLENNPYDNDEKELGDFTFGSQKGLKYRITTKLYGTKLHDQKYYKVIGRSGDYGFGYTFIDERNILGVTYRQQIFKQIIEKYNLEPYMQIKTFY